MGKRAGRRRRGGVPRNKNGRIKWGFDRERDPAHVAVEARERHLGATSLKIDWGDRRMKITPKDPLWGYALGRLVISGRGSPLDGITVKQHDAGWAFAELHIRYCAMKGFALPSPKAPGLMRMAQGISHTPDPSAAVLEAMERRYDEARSAVLAIVGKPGFDLLVQAACVDRMPHGPDETGTLRLALNALARVLLD